MAPSANRDRPSIQLPSWLFDIDDEDEEINTQVSIFQELEIDLAQILSIIYWMLTIPFLKMIHRPSKRHPLQISANVGFWGPCTVISIYCLLLWLGKIRDTPWIFVIWTIASTVNHLVSRVWYRSTLMFHVALLGYSITPILPFAIIIIFLRPPFWLATMLELLGVWWASSAAIYSYSTIMTVTVEQNSKLYLLYPVVIVMEMYFTSVMPLVRR